MKVILIENIPSLGKAGDIIQIANGFGRNYLIPKKLALEATSRNIHHLEHQRDSFLKKANHEKLQAGDLAAKIENLSCTVARSVGANEKLFGSVTSMDIQEFLASQGLALDRKKIHLPHPIKSLGNYSVPVKLHSEITVQLKVNVIPKEGEEKQP